MKAKLIHLIIGAVCIASTSLIAQADNGYSSSASQNSGSVGANGYSSSVGSRVGSAGANGYFSKGGSNQGSIGDNGYSSTGSQPRSNGHSHSNTYFVASHARAYKALFWGNMLAGAPIPNNAVAGGIENDHPLFICRGQFNGGVHPGKIVGGTCHISFGGREIALTHYQILVSGSRVNWVKASHGFIPKKAIKGGYEHNRPLYICQVPYNGGIHPGKVVGQACNIAWGGKEVSIPQYKVLVK